jgi:putative transposase
MNNRDYKQFGQNGYYHIYNRGNGKQDIFLGEKDYKVFIFRLRENLFPELIRQYNQSKPARYRRQALPDGAFSLVTYCLMPNHFHLLVRQNSQLPVTELLKKVCVGYSKYFNKSHGRVGALFEHKFRAVKVDSDSYLLWLSAYIHQNPKVAGLVKDLKDWSYSSYLDFIGKRTGTLCVKESILGQFKNVQDYERFVEDSYIKIREKKDLESLLIDEEDDGHSP